MELWEASDTKFAPVKVLIWLEGAEVVRLTMVICWLVLFTKVNTLPLTPPANPETLNAAVGPDT